MADNATYPSPGMETTETEAQSKRELKTHPLVTGLLALAAFAGLIVTGLGFFKPLDLNNTLAILKGPVLFFGCFIGLTAAMWWRDEAKKPLYKRGQVSISKWMWAHQTWRSWFAPQVSIVTILWCLAPISMPELVSCSRIFIVGIFCIETLGFCLVGNPDDKWLKRLGKVAAFVGAVLVFASIGTASFETITGQGAPGQQVQAPKVPSGTMAIKQNEEIKKYRSASKAMAEKGLYRVLLAPGDPETVSWPVSNNTLLWFDNPGMFAGTTWEGYVYVERDGVQYKLDPDSEMVGFSLWDSRTNKVFELPAGAAKHRPVSILVPMGGSSRSMKQLLKDLNNYPGDEILYPRFAINTHHPKIKGGKILGGYVRFEFRMGQMSRSDYN